MGFQSQTMSPVAASRAKTPPALPATYTTSFTPLAVVTPIATIGAVSAAKRDPWLSTFVFHFSSRLATFSVLSVLSVFAHPVRCGSFPNVGQSPAIAKVGSRPATMGRNLGLCCCGCLVCTSHMLPTTPRPSPKPRRGPGYGSVHAMKRFVEVVGTWVGPSSSRECSRCQAIP